MNKDYTALDCDPSELGEKEQELYFSYNYPSSDFFVRQRAETASEGTRMIKEIMLRHLDKLNNG